jgi:outer membrane protein OmpA-like peptidoglycan-associated protein
MEFRVSSDLAPRKSSQALVFVNPPNWKSYAKRKILGRVPVNAQKEAIILPTDWAYRVADELHEGMEMVWSHADWADGEDLVTAKVRPLRFDAAWRDFIQCRSNLIDYTFQDVEFSEFYYPANSTALTSKEKKRLDTIAEYVSLDPDFQHISIRAFSDSRGVRRLNLAVSQKRADAVRNYLIKKGVDKEKFMIVAQGEKKPKYNNRTASGRAKNRRVEINLVK